MNEGFKYSRPLQPKTPYLLLRSLFIQVRKLGLTDAEIAAKVDITPQQVYTYRHGKRQPSLERLEKMMKATGIGTLSIED